MTVGEAKKRSIKFALPCGTVETAWEISLDRGCEDCDRQGYTVSPHAFASEGPPTHRIHCESCNGTGFRLTDAGYAILQLVERHGPKEDSDD